MALPTLTENTFTHSDDKTTFYYSAGPSSGPLLIFIHGWPASGETWKPQLLALAALGFRTVAPDTRGYGRSSVPPAGGAHGVRAYALSEHVSDMRALLAHLDRPKAVWIGHDWGAGLVWALAAHHPELCVGAVGMTVPYRVVESGGMAALVQTANRDIYPAHAMPLAQWDYQAFHAEQPKLSARQLGGDVANTVKLLYSTGDPAVYGKPAWSARVREAGGWFRGAGPDAMAPETPFERSVLRHDRGMYERLVAGLEKNGFEGPNAYYLNSDVNVAYGREVPNDGYLHFPVLFVEAKWDTVCDTALSRLAEPMREYCKDLTEVSVDSGHWVALEKPQETNAAIVRWITTKLPHYFPGYWKTPFVSRA